MRNKPNCYKCIYRGTVPGDAHSCCHYPGNHTGMFDVLLPDNLKNAESLNIKADPHGIKNGWFLWPVNFDPVWLENCDGFKPLELKEETGELYNAVINFIGSDVQEEVTVKVDPGYAFDNYLDGDDDIFFYFESEDEMKDCMTQPIADFKVISFSKL